MEVVTDPEIRNNERVAKKVRLPGETNPEGKTDHSKLEEGTEDLEADGLAGETSGAP